MKGGKNIKKVVNNIILIILIITLIYICYLKYVCKKPIVKIAGYGFLVVITESMEPIIEKNELIVIKECDNYELDDIVTYIDVDENLVTHKIVELDNYSFISKGDGNKIVDESANISNIQGKVIYHSKILGVFILYYLKFVILIYVILLLVLYFKDKFMKESNYEEKEE